MSEEFSALRVEGRSAQVLVVEDEAIIALQIGAVLEQLGHVVCGMAATADEALAIAENKHPDFALVDVRLSNGSNGFQVARLLREKFGTVVLLVTAHPEIPADIRQFCCGCLSKPFTQTRLIDAIRLVLRLMAGDTPIDPPATGLRVFSEWVR